MMKTPDPFMVDEDNPEITSFEGFRPIQEVDPDMLVAIENARARRGRPKSDNPKQHIGLRLDADIVAWLKSRKGYNALVNEALREKMDG